MAALAGRAAARAASRLIVQLPESTLLFCGTTWATNVSGTTPQPPLTPPATQGLLLDVRVGMATGDTSKMADALADLAPHASQLDTVAMCARCWLCAAPGACRLSSRQGLHLLGQVSGIMARSSQMHSSAPSPRAAPSCSPHHLPNPPSLPALPPFFPCRAFVASAVEYALVDVVPKALEGQAPPPPDAERIRLAQVRHAPRRAAAAGAAAQGQGQRGAAWCTMPERCWRPV